MTVLSVLAAVVVVGVLSVSASRLGEVLTKFNTPRPDSFGLGIAILQATLVAIAGGSLVKTLGDLISPGRPPPRRVALWSVAFAFSSLVGVLSCEASLPWIARERYNP